MNIVTIFLTITFLFSSIVYPQELRLAPEIWSSPKIITEIDEWSEVAWSPSIDYTGKKLYFEAGYISSVEKIETGWATPVTLNSNINQNLARTPCISPNGKRLFFSWYVGGWDLYYSDWDSIANDWDLAKSCGPEVNSPVDAEIGCTLPNDTTLIFLRNNTAFISNWNNENNQWGTATGFPTVDLATYSDWGIYIAPSKSKYYHVLSRTDSINQDEDIYVSFKDTAQTNPRGYTIPYILNIYYEADSLFKIGEYLSRIEGFPSLTPDGKTMYFMADYTGDAEIYISRMLIDENGDTVASFIKNHNNLIPKRYSLYQNYPNPFNPNTTIQYDLSHDEDVILTIYNIQGQKVREVEKGFKPAGSYQVIFDGSGLASGVYFYKFEADKFTDVKRMLLIK